MNAIWTVCRYRGAEALLMVFLGAGLIGLTQHWAHDIVRLQHRLAVERAQVHAQAELLRQASDRSLEVRWRQAAEAWQTLRGAGRPLQCLSSQEVNVLSASTVTLSKTVQGQQVYTAVSLQGAFDAVMRWLAETCTDHALPRMTSFRLEDCTTCSEPSIWQLKVGLTHWRDGENSKEET